MTRKSIMLLAHKIAKQAKFAGAEYHEALRTAMGVIFHILRGYTGDLNKYSDEYLIMTYHSIIPERNKDGNIRISFVRWC